MNRSDALKIALGAMKFAQAWNTTEEAFRGYGTAGSIIQEMIAEEEKKEKTE
ncbi:hypothetical protein [Methanorbis furvi]|uniref:Uncharacterized protein n=1 Tax=Methanorbis furvi TaxID=3028299 RepID=A0AAE4MD42_9EURY|nr:hypothetical protein [Methanocorpusculaceae archaeon Ag1]